MYFSFTKFNHPYIDTQTLIWIFDQSSGHNMFPEDALLAFHINVTTSRKQPGMHPGILPDGPTAAVW